MEVVRILHLLLEVLPSLELSSTSLSSKRTGRRVPAGRRGTEEEQSAMFRCFLQTLACLKYGDHRWSWIKLQTWFHGQDDASAAL